jgi:hypothetical protein
MISGSPSMVSYKLNLGNLSIRKNGQRSNISPMESIVAPGTTYPPKAAAFNDQFSDDSMDFIGIIVANTEVNSCWISSPLCLSIVSAFCTSTKKDPANAGSLGDNW